MSQSSADSEEMCPTPPTSTSTPRRLVGRKRPSNGPDAFMQEAVSVLSQIKDRTVTPSQPKADDEDDIFGKHVASEMRKIQDMRQKGLARIKIQSILFETQFNTPSPSALVSHQPRHNSVSQSGKNWQAEPNNYEPDNDSNSNPFYNRTLFRL